MQGLSLWTLKPCKTAGQDGNCRSKASQGGLADQQCTEFLHSTQPPTGNAGSCLSWRLLNVCPPSICQHTCVLVYTKFPLVLCNWSPCIISQSMPFLLMNLQNNMKCTVETSSEEYNRGCKICNGEVGLESLGPTKYEVFPLYHAL